MMTRPHQHAVLVHPGPGKTMTIPKAAVVSPDKDHNVQLVSAEEVRLCAYRKWECAGRPIGDGMQFWLEAEQELLQEK